MAEHSQLDHSQQTREKILRTAARLFSQRGYANTALSQVAREACVSKALILWHFDSKEKLFRAALGCTLEPYFIDVQELAGLDEGQQIGRLIDLFHEFVLENVYSVRFFLGLVVHREEHPDRIVEKIDELYRLFRSLLTEIIDSGRRAGRFRSDVEPALDASLILASLDGILIEHFMSEEPPDDPSQLLTHLKRVTLRRLRSDGTPA
jgi:AcrR family transcriptional regulator